MKKFKIKNTLTDEEYEISTEEEKEVVDKEADEAKEKEMKDEEGLTSEEISALKELAKVAPKLITLVNETDVVEEEMAEEEVKEEEESVLDTDETEEKKKSAKDSFGSLRNTKITNDAVASDEEFYKSWARRGRKGE